MSDIVEAAQVTSVTELGLVYRPSELVTHLIAKAVADLGRHPVDWTTLRLATERAAHDRNLIVYRFTADLITERGVTP